MGQDPARGELAELLLDEAGQAASIAPVGGYTGSGFAWASAARRFAGTWCGGGKIQSDSNVPTIFPD